MAAITERRTKDGGVTYHVRVRRKGAKTAFATFKHKTDAKAWVCEVEDAMRKGKYFERQEAKSHTLNEAIDRFVQEFGYGTYESRRCHVRLWKKELGHLLLSDIPPAVISDVIAKWKRDLNERGELRGGNTLNRYITTLSCVFTAAVKDWGWTTTNPVRDVRRQKEAKGRTRFLLDEERERLLEACKKSYCPFIHLVVVLALSTGMRKSEIRNIKWSHVDLDKGVLILYKTKNGDTRRVAIRGLALDLFRQHAKVRRIDSDFVFPSEISAQTKEPFDITKAWEDARRRANIQEFVFHDLRHSCASYLAMGGASLLEIAEVLGHKTLEMVKRYSHLAESHTAKVVEQMNHRIFG